MYTKVRDINIIVQWNGTHYFFDVYQNEYRNLMTLIYDKIYVDNFGECKGIGRCGTCHVHILKAEHDLFTKEKSEQLTLDKIESSCDKSRLSCQILIDKKLNGATVEIFDDGEIQPVLI